MKFAVVVFPGSNSDYDAFYAASHVLGEQSELVWHKDTDLKGADAVILPGGFAHGDYLRTGAIARFSPIMAAVKAFADRGGPVLGICNGFQVLLELARRGISREQAYEWVQRNAMRSFHEQRDFKTLLLADTDITRVLPAAEIEKAFDLKEQLRNVDAVFKRVFTA